MHIGIILEAELAGRILFPLRHVGKIRGGCACACGHERVFGRAAPGVEMHVRARLAGREEVRKGAHGVGEKHHAEA